MYCIYLSASRKGDVRCPSLTQLCNVLCVCVYFKFILISTAPNDWQTEQPMTGKRSNQWLANGATNDWQTKQPMTGKRSNQWLANEATNDWQTEQPMTGKRTLVKSFHGVARQHCVHSYSYRNLLGIKDVGDGTHPEPRFRLISALKHKN